MNVARPLATVLLLLGVFCPLGAHGVVHAVDDAHVRAHEEGRVHEHGSEQERSEHELRHADETPRVGASAARVTPVLRVLLFTDFPALSFPPGRSALAVAASLDPPPPQTYASPACAGRAPPV